MPALSALQRLLQVRSSPKAWEPPEDTIRLLLDFAASSLLELLSLALIDKNFHATALQRFANEYRYFDIHLNSGASPDLTGMVVDSGDALTHVIPVADGYVISSCIQEIPLGGKHVTEFVSDMLRDRGEPVPPEQRLEAARQIKEQHSYLSRDVVEEYQKFDQDAKRFKSLSGVFPKTKEKWSIAIGYERFLAPEIFFNPEIFVDTVTKPLPDLVDRCIMGCPMDYRRRLYNNIVLSGGSTTFTHFKERLQRDLQVVVDTRLAQVQASAGGAAPRSIPVQVRGGKRRNQQRFAAWLGGSLFAAEPNFASHCKTKKEYDEYGPSCMRASPVLMG